MMGAWNRKIVQKKPHFHTLPDLDAVEGVLDNSTYICDCQQEFILRTETEFHKDWKIFAYNTTKRYWVSGQEKVLVQPGYVTADRLD